MSGQLDRPPAVVRGIEVSTIANYEGEAILTCQAKQDLRAGAMRCPGGHRLQPPLQWSFHDLQSPPDFQLESIERAENEAVRSIDVHAMSVQSLQLL